MSQEDGSDLEARQQDELNSIESIYGDIFNNITPTKLIWNKKPSPHFQIFLSSAENADHPTVSLTLDFSLTPTYPLSSPIVKVLDQKHISKLNMKKVENKIHGLIKEYQGEEVCFIIISDIKDLLDEFQQTTQKVLSLDEEREERMQMARRMYEENEAEKEHKQELEKKKQSRELTEQLSRIQDDYYEDSAHSTTSVGGTTTRETKEDIDLLPRNVRRSDQCFIFDNAINGEIPNSKSKFKFKAVQGFIAYKQKNDILFAISRQYIVKPYLSPEIQTKFDKKGIEVSYILTEVRLDNPFWLTDEGKTQIRAFESELEKVRNFDNENIIKLYGYQIDRCDNCWIVRLLSQFSQTAEYLSDISYTVGSFDWGLARSWLIQLLPGIESLHNAGLTHKLICLQTVLVCEVETDLYYQHSNTAVSSNEDDESTTKVLKLSHPSYGFSLLSMLYMHPNCNSRSVRTSKYGFMRPFIPENWIDPEFPSGPKTDIWNLGVLFLRIMIHHNALTKMYPKPEDFIRFFNPEYDANGSENAETVYDLLSRMLQPKASKRPSLLELNALKFFRDGIDQFSNPETLPQAISAPVFQDPPVLDSSEPINAPLRSLRQQAVTLESSRRNLSPGLPSRRRLSNQNQNMSLGDSISNPASAIDSRYEREFEEIGKLGKGGFGEVVKARNRMEGTFYAIKKIKHKANKLEVILSEVLSLARLNHQYIVRYYGCWVEEFQETNDTGVVDSDEEEESTSESDTDDDFDSPIARSSSFLRSHDNSFQVDYLASSLDAQLHYSDDSDFDDLIEFANSSDEDAGDDEESDEETDRLSDSEMSSFERSRKSLELINHSRSEIKKLKNLNQAKSILYIQMEFCENNTLLNLIEQGLPGNPNEYWRLFRQLLEAVSYIHSSGFIHRDLKPMNIFIDKSNNIKVGDFGLAKKSQFSSVISDNNQVADTGNKDFSTVVGTVFYTAKEVATGEYDEKVDMYSLGIIFFEMCHPLSTGMERAATLNNLRLASVDFPANFTDSKFKTEKKIIRSLLDHNPKLRPGASELLQSGWIPVEHQDHIIKEALNSLADPASPWQQQVRETLFNQPYSLAKDLMFDNYSKHSHSHHLEHSVSDYLIFSQMIHELFRIFHTHGGVVDYSSSILMPKSHPQARERCYEVLDRSGQILTLPYDLVLPTARFFSRTSISLSKLYRHEFVYRPSIRGTGAPDKYSAVNFDIANHDRHGRVENDAECIKIVDEISQSFPCFKVKNAHVFIMINHSDILNCVVDFAFGGSVKMDEKKKFEIFGVLSQLGLGKAPEEIKTYLREDFKIQHTIIKDLIDTFDFTVEPERAKHKLKKVMADSPLLVKIEKALDYLMSVLSIVKSLGVSTQIYFNPLYNYNSRYYVGGIMFQAYFKNDRSKNSIFVTGGRYDRLVSALSNKDLNKSTTPYAVGFQISATYLFILMKTFDKRVNSTSGTAKPLSELSKVKWKKIRCDVLVSSLSESHILDSGYDLVKNLWANNISCDIVHPTSQEDLLHKAQIDGSNWVVIIKQPNSKASRKKTKKSTNQFKPLRVKDISSGKDIDVDYEELIDYLRSEIDERNNEETGDVSVGGMSNSNSVEHNNDESDVTEQSVPGGGPMYNFDIDQKVIAVSNDAPRGRKNNNKRDKWEVENDAKVAGADLVKSLASTPVISVDARDDVLEMISITSLKQSDEWIRKVVYSTNNLPKSFATNIYNTLIKEGTKGAKWAILHSPKSDKTVIVDLQR